MDVDTRKKIAASLRVAAAKLSAASPEDVAARLAKKHFRVHSLETKGSDREDFHSVAVWSIKDALEEAYRAGLKDGKSEADLNR